MFLWALLGLLLVAPYPLTVWAQRRALRGGAGTSAGWFDFLQTVQWIAIAYTGCWPSTYSVLAGAIVPWLARHGLVAWTTPVTMLAIGVPILGFQVFAAVAIQTVNRAIRGSEVSGDEVVSDQMRALAGVGILFGALCGTLVALTLGMWRLALGIFLAGLLLATLGPSARRRGSASPLAVTHGELRDRLFAWAERAGVRVKQLYVVPLARTRIANAVAVQGQSVMVTDYLLTQLDRDELDAVMAHELAHLRHRHPSWLAVTLGVCGMGAWWVYSIAHVAGPVAFVAATLVFMAVSRRFEYAADAGAVALGIRPEALITALARIARVNHFPQDWSRLREWTLTHPSNRRRAMRIASRAGIPFERIVSLMNDETPRADHHPVPAQARAERVFTTAFKSGVIQRNGWALLFVNATAGAVLALLLGWTGFLDGLGAFRFVPVGALTFVVAFLLVQYLGMRPYRALRPKLWKQQQRPRLGPGEREPLWVGLSPGSEPRLYEGFLTWDVGFLDLRSDRLEYRGEETRFSLARHEITSIETGPRFPAWVPVFGVVARWRSGEREGCFTLLPIEATGLLSYARESRSLRNHLERWHASVTGAAPTNSSQVTSGDIAFTATPVTIGTPPVGPVTGVRPGEAFKPASLVLPVILQLTIGTCVAALMGLQVWSRQGLGASDAVLATMMSYALLITPYLGAWLRRRRVVDRDDREIRRAA